jgi:hypothetical protein
MKRSMLLPASIYLIEAVSSHVNSFSIEKHILDTGHYVQDRFVQYPWFFVANVRDIMIGMFR